MNGNKKMTKEWKKNGLNKNERRLIRELNDTLNLCFWGDATYNQVLIIMEENQRVKMHEEDEWMRQIGRGEVREDDDSRELGRAKHWCRLWDTEPRHYKKKWNKKYKTRDLSPLMWVQFWKLWLNVLQIVYKKLTWRRQERVILTTLTNLWLSVEWRYETPN